MIPAESVEAAAKAMLAAGNHVGGWDALPVFMQNQFTRDARAALEAAAPYMLEDKRGAGDYLPGWDDRKTLAGIWQEHAMLPVEGLSDGVYSALIAVATWGYQQRKDEEL